MPAIYITLPSPINKSLQAKPLLNPNTSAMEGHDIIYFIKSAATSDKLPHEIGKCIGLESITPDSNPRTKITIQVTGQIEMPSEGDFLFFTKNTEIGTSGLDGCIAEIQMKNTSTASAELFAVGSDVVLSSK